MTCTVLAELKNGAQINVTAAGDWPYAAIQGAATQARQQMDGRLTSCGTSAALTVLIYRCLRGDPNLRVHVRSPQL